ncbi:hypothetical protein P4H27_31885 [Paenibacillus taichungensis]|uniref:hypothetical protein n=1 Tax=Paenibacillus taichungensis TaxID=484184 RepID=UPI002DBB9210|nr:hypothetical protein [Paenibacillus taichungensis]MEC0111560.1 hypothetical protein [Paenibacillus taichungensis]MEC0199081.1 hypothetical protein [Paenibacillus taichungensis]
MLVRTLIFEMTEDSAKAREQIAAIANESWDTIRRKLKLVGIVSRNEKLYCEDEEVLNMDVFHVIKSINKGDSEEVAMKKVKGLYSQDESIKKMQKKALEKLPTNKAKAQTKESESNLLVSGQGGFKDNNRMEAVKRLVTGEDINKNRTYRGFYFDEDVLAVIDSAKSGKKSDLINELLRLSLEELKML